MPTPHPRRRSRGATFLGRVRGASRRTLALPVIVLVAVATAARADASGEAVFAWPGLPQATWVMPVVATTPLGVVVVVLALMNLRIRRIADVSADARERQHADAEDVLTTRMVRQELLVRFAREALSTSDLTALLARVPEMACATLAVPLASVVTLDTENGGLRMSTGQGWEPGEVRSPRLPHGTRSHSGYTLENGTTVTRLETEQRFTVHPLLVRAGARHGIACPVLARTRPYGTLNVYDTHERVFDHDDVATLEMLGTIVAAAVDRHEAEQANRRNAVHDPLTGLPARTLFVDRLDAAVDRLSGADGDGCDSRGVAVLLVDLDDFKAVNNSLTHCAGDELLVTFARRLRAAIGPGDTLARLWGDQFAVLLHDVDPTEALHRAEQLTDIWADPIAVAGNPVHVTASVGFAVSGRDDGCPSGSADVKSGLTLLREADTATYRAKERGRGHVEMFDEQMRDRARARLELKSALHVALTDESLDVAYQPVVNTLDGSVCAVEALARWTHPTRGVITPDEFIPVAESGGLIVELGTWVLRTACRQVAQWRAALPGVTNLRVNVNVSARQLVDPQFLDVVSTALAESTLPPDALGLEITETLLVEDERAARQVLGSLQSMGVRIVLDDFGTGYSSMSYLQRFPVESIKIDRSFVAGLGTNPGDTTIVSAIVALAHSLGLKVVAEGVETDRHRRHLGELGCDYAQGYFYGRPLAPADLETTLRAGHSGEAGCSC